MADAATSVMTNLDPKRILLAVDDSAASRRAVMYFTDIVAPDRVNGVVLFHVLPPTPPGRLEHADVLEREESSNERSAAEQKLLAPIRTQLESAGVPAALIFLRTESCAGEYEIVPDILSAARAHECGTIVVGREAFTGLKKLFRHHIADAIIKSGEGMGVWVVG